MDPPESDPFNEEEVEARTISSKPPCFVIFGKPGSGKTTLAKRLAKTWKCQMIDGVTSINNTISKDNEKGKQANEKLHSGDAITEELTVNAIFNKLESPEVLHHGYVLDGFPIVNNQHMSVNEQFETLKSLKYKPDYIINLKIPDDDLWNRRSGFKIDPKTNIIYTKEQYDEQYKNQSKEDGETSNESDEDEEKDDDDDNDETDDASNADSEDQGLEGDNDEEEEQPKDDKNVLSLEDRLVTRTEDQTININESLNLFKNDFLPKLESFIADHNQQCVIELNANLPIKALFKALMTKLQSLTPVIGAKVPLALQGGEEHEEIPEDAETDDMLRTLAASSMIAPGFRWRRSKWGRYCPVSLFEGSITLGLPQYAVSFLDKMYLFSSPENLTKFKRCPRMYLSLPHPLPPCKASIVGGPMSGKTTLCKKLAVQFDAKIIDVQSIEKVELKKRTEELMQKTKLDTTEAAIARVQSLVEKESYEKIEEAEIQKDDNRFTPINEESSDISGSNDESVIEPSNDVQTNKITVDESHPEVMKAVREALEEVERVGVTLTAEEQVDLVEIEIKKLYDQMQLDNEFGPFYGRWILDGFPRNREQFNIMVERGVIPDLLICLKDNEEGDFLLSRWYETNMKDDNEEEKEVIDRFVPDSDEKEQQKLDIAYFERDWNGLQAAVRSISHLETLFMSCDQLEEEIFMKAVNKLQEPFTYKGWEYSGIDQDEEAEDMEDEDDLDVDDESDDGKDSRKPFGESRHFCPVMLQQKDVLWPGMPDCAAKYREKVYYFANPDSRSLFVDNPETFLPQSEPLMPPSIRLFIVGTKGSGKTHHGRTIAKELNLFHISFEDYLQELILAKTKKKIGRDHETIDDNIPEDYTEELLDGNVDAMDDELQADTASKDADPTKTDEEKPTDKNQEEEEEEEIEFTTFEENIKMNILEGEPLTTETLEEILTPWWHKDLFKQKGFVLEGFPRTSEEVRFLAESGLFPDCCLFLSVEESETINRLLPPIHKKWKEKERKKFEFRKKKQEFKMKKKEEIRKKRREEIKAEMELKEIEKQAKLENRLERRKNRSDSDDEESEEEDDDDEDDDEVDIEGLLDEELNNDDDDDDFDGDDEDEETEEEALDRMKSEISERYDEEMGRLMVVQESMDEFLIPRLEVAVGRKPHIVEYVIKKLLKPIVTYRNSLFERCQPISEQLAKKMLCLGYKCPSRFGWWCPVQLMEGDVIAPKSMVYNSSYPVIHRGFIYYLSSEIAREKFISFPSFYLKQISPKPTVPIKLAIIGPPKSGKTSLANRFIREFSLIRLSIGEAIRRVIATYKHTSLAKQIEEHIMSGLTVPDPLAIVALETAILDIDCQINGFVLDGFPLTRHQVELMMERFIIPFKVIELQVCDSEIFLRGTSDRRSKDRILPLHDSHNILMTRLASYQREIPSVCDYFKEKHRSLLVINGEASKWKVWQEALAQTKKSITRIQDYLQRINQGKSASIANMCVTTEEMYSRLGSYGQYCPVSLNGKDELVDCSETISMDFVAEYQRKYYKMANQTELELFLNQPECYVPPLANRVLPSVELLPHKLTKEQLKKKDQIIIEMKGYCPVTYADGKKRYEAICTGNDEYMAEYQGKVFCFESEAKQDKFMRKPSKYSSLVLPRKLPPSKDPLPVSDLPMLGFMEQSVSISLNQSLTAVGCFKPKFPFLTIGQSALLYVAYHLKAFNSKSSDYIRKKYCLKLKSYEDKCQLITFLGRYMTYRYKEPEERPIDFEQKMSSFLSLKETPPATKWLV